MVDPTSVQIVARNLSAVVKTLRDVIDSFAHAVRLSTSSVDALLDMQLLESPEDIAAQRVAAED